MPDLGGTNGKMAPLMRAAPEVATKSEPEKHALTDATLKFTANPKIAPIVISLPETGPLLLRLMSVGDYPNVMKLLPQVSRSSKFYDQATVESMLALGTFFPFVVVTEASDEILAYAELHRMPHLGRGFDGRLEKVIVKNELRGRKIAQTVCKRLQDIAKNELCCGRIDLTVEKPDAKTVYGNLGFAKVETEVWRWFV